MMGKLNAWRDDRRESNSHGGMGGLVSIEDLNAKLDKATKPKTPETMKKPKLSLGRLAPALGFTKSRESTPSNSFSPSISHEHGLFANIPNVNNGRGQTSPLSFHDVRPSSQSRRPSAVSDQAIIHTSDPLQPKTADPSVTRRRSKTSPHFGTTNGLVYTHDKPLPLAIDADARRKDTRSKTARRSSDDHGILRPKTADSQAHTKPTKPSSKSQYTLTPTPSIRLKHSRQESQSSALSRGPSTKSSVHPTQRPSRATSQSATSQDTPLTSIHPSIRSSILDEVEGTLSATITELQGLQGNWHQDRTSALSPDPFRPSSTGQQSIRSTRSSQDHGYFPVMPVKSHSPLPHSPMKPSPLTNGADAPVQNLQQVYNEQKKHSHAVLLENDALKRKLDYMSTRLAEFEQEKAVTSRAAKETQENLQLMLTRLGEAKVAEQAAQNEFQAAKLGLDAEKMKLAALTLELEVERKSSSHLKARLQEVNLQKIELLERDMETQSRMALANQKLKATARELKETKNANPSSKISDQKDDFASSMAMMTFRLEDMQRQLLERDATIVSLKKESDSWSATSPSSQSAESYSKIRRIEEELRTARVERDQFSAILHAEIRRTTVEEHNREHPSSAFLQNRTDLADAVQIARQRAWKYLGTSGHSHGNAAELQKEIDYYLNDIVLYKLDVKGYKKDLRNAREQIKELSRRVNVR